MTITKQDTSLPEEVRVRLHYKRDPSLYMVLDYLNDRGVDLRVEIIEMLKARFIPEATKANGKMDRALAIHCIGKLKGYIYAIEQLAELEPTEMPMTRSRTLVEDFEDPEDLEEETVDVRDIDRMFGIAN
jgi:hypothetical protein